jgi:subtilisin family serine protease
MATPHVAGAAALILASNPTLNTAMVKSTILSHVDAVPSLTGRTITGGRLNVYRSLAPPELIMQPMLGLLG